MSSIDRRGLSHSGQTGIARDLCDQALTQLLRFKGDPMGLSEEALKHSPNCVQALLIQAHALAFSLHPKLMGKARNIVTRLKSCEANEREISHIDAITLWLDGRFDDAATKLGRITQESPTDLLALMFAHQADFFSSSTDALRHRPERVLAVIPTDLPGRGFVVGMAAFGHEEAGDYQRASELAQEALTLDPQDVWAIHAMAHILEMQGEDEGGIAWYQAHVPIWSQDCFFACHNWWHLALYHIDRLETDQALVIFDQHMTPDKRSISLNLCDCVALLWRLHLLGVDVMDRMTLIATLFEKHITVDAHIFNDVHAALAFAMSDRIDDLGRLESRMIEASAASTRYAEMLRKAGLPALAAFRAFAREDYSQAVDYLGSMMPDEALMTGSHAQRDLLPLTLIEAQIRAKHSLDASKAIRIRLQGKPNSAKWQQDLQRI